MRENSKSWPLSFQGHQNFPQNFPISLCSFLCLNVKESDHINLKKSQNTMKLWYNKVPIL